MPPHNKTRPANQQGAQFKPQVNLNHIAQRVFQVPEVRSDKPDAAY